jgi:hypothetical protein
MNYNFADNQSYLGNPYDAADAYDAADTYNGITENGTAMTDSSLRNVVFTDSVVKRN